MSWNLLQAIFVLFPDWLPIPQLYSHFPEWHGPDQRHLSGGPFQVDYKVTLQPCHGWMGQVIQLKLGCNGSFRILVCFIFEPANGCSSLQSLVKICFFTVFQLFCLIFIRKRGSWGKKMQKLLLTNPGSQPSEKITKNHFNNFRNFIWYKKEIPCLEPMKMVFFLNLHKREVDN